MDDTFEIMFDDLTPETQERFLEFMECTDEDSEDWGNWEIIPIVTIDKPEDNQDTIGD